MNDILIWLEKAGLPSGLLALIGAAWWIGRESRSQPPEAKVAAALDTLAQEVKALRLEMTDRLARVETRVENLEAHK